MWKFSPIRERNMDAHLLSVPPLMLEDPVIEGQQGQSRDGYGTARQHDHSDPLGGKTTFLLQSDASATPTNPVRRTHSHIKGVTRLH